MAVRLKYCLIFSGGKMAAPWQEILNKIDDYRWEIPKSYKAGMLVPGLIFTNESMLNHIWQEQVFQQVANVAFLPVLSVVH